MQRNLYVYTYLHADWDDVERVLRDDPTTLLQEATRHADERTRVVTIGLRADVGAFRVGRDAAVQLGELRVIDPHCVSLPVHWSAHDHQGLFPAMEGYLEAARLASHPPLTQLSFIGQYRPPLGVLGALGDATLGHRVAEVAVHNFLTDVAERIVTTTAVPAPATG